MFYVILAAMPLQNKGLMLRLFRNIWAIATGNIHFDTLSLDNKNIITSCGSDSHGYECDDTKHGILGSQSMSEERLNKFLNKLNEI